MGNEVLAVTAIWIVEQMSSPTFKKAGIPAVVVKQQR
jgi:hypothetical protein